MSKTRKKFIFYAITAVFVLLTVMLTIINTINFTMAAEDADRVTMRIVEGNGAFEEIRGPEPVQFAPFGGKNKPVGPDSPELPYSARYFTVKFKKDGNSSIVAMNISAYDEASAVSTAKKLLNKSATGWVDTYYRYRVYEHKGSTYVTVIDQGRELLPSYRILIISVIGEIIGVAVCFGFLVFISGKLFKPLEEADRKQKAFISEAEKQIKLPLTVINTDIEIIEKEYGESEFTQSIRRQVKKMTDLTKRLGDISGGSSDKEQKTVCDISNIWQTELDKAKMKFEEKGINVSVNIEEDVTLECDEGSAKKTAAEIIDNAYKFARKYADFEIIRSKGHIIITQKNDTELADENIEQVFDRFVKLDNAKNTDGNGLGLNYVKNAVKESGGRVSANLQQNTFILKITY